MLSQLCALHRPHVGRRLAKAHKLLGGADTLQLPRPASIREHLHLLRKRVELRIKPGDTLTGDTEVAGSERTQSW